MSTIQNGGSANDLEQIRNIEEITPATLISVAFNVTSPFHRWTKSTKLNFEHVVMNYSNFCQRIGVESVLSYPTWENVKEWIYHQEQQGLASRTIKARVASLSSIFEFFINLGVLNVNPFKSHRIPINNEQTQRTMPLDLDDIIQVLNGVEDLKQEGFDFELQVRMMLFTSLYNQNLVSLKVKDVSFDQGLIYCQSRSRNRAIPIPSTLLAMLENHVKNNHLKQEDPLLHGIKGHPLSPRHLNIMTKKISEKIGWGRRLLRPSDLRLTIPMILNKHGIYHNVIYALLGTKPKLTPSFINGSKTLERLRQELNHIEDTLAKGVKKVK
jgi:site-specific recombinase XerC